MSTWLRDNLKGIPEEDQKMFLACVQSKQMDGWDEGE